MPRRLLVFGLLIALSQVGTGCCHVRQRIAYRWHYYHGPCVGCTPAFRIPPPAPLIGGPIIRAPLVTAPMYSGPVAGPIYSGPVGGCPSCYTPPEPGPISYNVPFAAPTGPIPGPPLITGPNPLLQNPTIVTDPGSGVPNTMPPPPKY